MVPCPRCRNLAPFDKTLNPSRPFCSERCKDIDFGAWATEKYAVAAAPDSSNADLDELDDLEGLNLQDQQPKN